MVLLPLPQLVPDGDSDGIVVHGQFIVMDRSDLKGSEEVHANLYVLTRKVFVDVRHLIRHLVSILELHQVKELRLQPLRQLLFGQDLLLEHLDFALQYPDHLCFLLLEVLDGPAEEFDLVEGRIEHIGPLGRLLLERDVVGFVRPQKHPFRVGLPVRCVHILLLVGEDVVLLEQGVSLVIFSRCFLVIFLSALNVRILPMV
mmetsp:Transcript_34087/g.76737  ORF Transcript_34087/g.76737 Transcript_34087/m.76737 type:complete len:201 (-) Transcript_34087:3533-4135(-)